MKIAITGANGYIGGHLVRKLIEQGFSPICMTRRKSPLKNVKWIYYDLSQTSIKQPNEKFDVLIHLATNTKEAHTEENLVELNAIKFLIRLAKDNNSKFIFISSQTASPSAPSPYGILKWKLEEIVIASGGIVVRPGLIYGGDEKGLYGELVNYLKKSIFLPSFLPAPQINPIFIEDFIECLIKIINLKSKSMKKNIFCLASENSISFTFFLRRMSHFKVNKLRFFVPIPIAFIRLLSKIIGKKNSARFKLSQVNSLFHLPIMKTRNDLNYLGIKLCSLEKGLSSFENLNFYPRLEASAFLEYILRSEADEKVIDRYARWIQKQNLDDFILPKIFITFPKLIFLLEFNNRNKSHKIKIFQRKLKAAIIFAENCPQGFLRFSGYSNDHSLLSSFFYLIKFLILEIIYKFLSILAFPLIRRFVFFDTKHK
jgi:nucleoside-diphosphate-sugar epimerase